MTWTIYNSSSQFFPSHSFSELLRAELSLLTAYSEAAMNKAVATFTSMARRSS